MMFDEPSSVTLRYYQEEMRDNTLENLFKKGSRGTLNVAPTACGKSITMAATGIAGSKHGGVLILAHYRGLVKNNRKAVERLGYRCYIYHGEEKDVIWSDVKNNGAIVSASIQAMIHAIKKIDPDAVKLILIDEGHHAIVDSAYHTVVSHFSKAKIALYSATPDRADGVKLVGDGCLCDTVSANYQARRFIQEGWILNPFITFEQTIKLDYSLIPDDSTHITEKQAEKVWEANKANYAVIKPFLDKCGSMQSIGFAPSVKLAKLWARLCNESRDGKAEYVASYRPGDYTDAHLEFDDGERRLIESRFESGQTQYLWNASVYLEGADLVAAQVCMLGAVTDSRSKLAQMIGRVLRPPERDGKSILIGMERATDEERRAALAASHKPCAYVFDYGGSTGPLKLAHPVDFMCSGDGSELPPEVRQRVIDRCDELAEGGEDRLNLEEIVLEQEESYKKFLVQDARIRKAIAVECETMTRDVDPWGDPEIAGHQRYTVRKINPPAPKVIEQIKKLTAELGKRYSDDFYRNLSNAGAYGVLAGLRKKADKKRSGEPCPQWVIDKLQAHGHYETPNNKSEGIKTLTGIERRKK